MKRKHSTIKSESWTDTGKRIFPLSLLDRPEFGIRPPDAIPYRITVEGYRALHRWHARKLAASARKVLR